MDFQERFESHKKFYMEHGFDAAIARKNTFGVSIETVYESHLITIAWLAEFLLPPISKQRARDDDAALTRALHQFAIWREDGEFNQADISSLGDWVLPQIERSTSTSSMLVEMPDIEELCDGKAELILDSSVDRGYVSSAAIGVAAAFVDDVFNLYDIAAFAENIEFDGSTVHFEIGDRRAKIDDLIQRGDESSQVHLWQSFLESITLSPDDDFAPSQILVQMKREIALLTAGLDQFILAAMCQIPSFESDEYWLATVKEIAEESGVKERTIRDRTKFVTPAIVGSGSRPSKFDVRDLPKLG